ncbi:RagB/SusD family nutrient uptake outer membrane protein [Fibrella sp. HMF5335]|uniref:RagB/SusD family nutrient uptake outer membrane protein n=1 Tax=Fibrella rubiginis TaxID=2817060 RepID=A0A939GK93_9BACT|nr:RagB/SusD family nutrient uptake outer membrane protein [Fibrella rubiginis]MBO0939871.1 RagB/SusD family nutrient uptake outer membrane protein [Fibrella rubiginis]
MKTKLITFLCLLSLGACSDMLNEQPRGDYAEAAFYQTSAQAVLAINAAYQPLSFASDNNRLWVFGDVASDDAAKGGDPGDQADIGLVDNFQIFPNNGPVESEWGVLYEGINRANLVLQRVPAINMDATLKNRVLGEARFLRALNYFYLVNIYGDVPLILEPRNADKLQVTQSAVGTIYAQAIEADLLVAIQNLPAAHAGPDVGRATKGAAQALLAKAYLYQQKWQPALDQAQAVINSGQYDLLPVYANNFRAAYKNNRESVFAVQHLSGQVPFQGNRLNQWFAPRPNENGYFFDAPTPGFVAEFEQTAAKVADPRLDYSVGRAGTTWLNGEPFDPQWSPTGYLNKKHVQPLAEVPAATKGDGNLNYVMIRYADVLLMAAEALTELNRGAEALPYLNRVRKRARESYLNDPALAPATGAPAVPANLLPDVVSTSQATLRDAIRHERRVELGLEFHRYFDLARYGQAYAEAALRDKNYAFAKNRYVPLPQSERDTNKALK